MPIREESRLGAIRYFLGPDLICLGVFGVLLVLLMFIYRLGPSDLSFVHESIVMPLVVLLVLVGVALISGVAKRRVHPIVPRDLAGSALAIVRDWFPLVMIVFVYENVHDLTIYIRPDVVDGSLRRIDEILFFTEPSLALQRITRPWLTELMSAAYGLYFLYPTLVLTMLYRRGAFVDFREVGLALSLAFYLGLVGFMFVPAVGPRYAMAQEFTVPLDGYFLTAPAAEGWRALETIQRDCFPSLHTALTTITLIYLWRHRSLPHGRLLLSLCTPAIGLLWASTLYLRYHYGVDVLAGWILGVVCAYVAPRFVRRYYAGHSVPVRS